MFMNDENKRHGQAIKIARETTKNQKKKYNSVKHLQRQQFSFTKTSIKVSLEILRVFKRKAYRLAGFPARCLCKFEGELLEARKALKVFFLQPNL